MIRPTVAILCEGDWPALEPTLASVRAHGLAVEVGITGQRPRGHPPAAVGVHPVVWRDDFADARNQIAARIAAPWLLWLDADERLARYANVEAEGDVLAVLIRDRTDLTPRPIIRLQRNAPGVRWRRAVHETIPTVGDPPILEAILIEHAGYAEKAIAAAKVRRNHAIAAAARAGGEDEWVYALEDARHAEATGGDAFRAWLAVFNHPGASPSAPGAADGRVEAAEALAAMGYATPARLVLEGNPRIAPLALALLVEEARRGAPDEGRIAATLALLGGDADPRYAMPRSLVGADRARLARWIGHRAGPRAAAAGR